MDSPPTAADAAQVMGELTWDIASCITTQAGGRNFEFVVDGLHPAALEAEFLVSAWDHNTAMFATTPGVAVIEELCRRRGTRRRGRWPATPRTASDPSR